MKSPRLSIIIISTIQHLRRTKNGKIIIHYSSSTDELVSNSMAAGKAFIDAYQDNHSGDEVKHIDLFTEDIPHIDKDVLIGWGKAAKGEELTSEESKKLLV